MRPLTDSTPKVMLPVANRPILEHIINAASDAGIKEFLIITGYKEELIKEYFGTVEMGEITIDYIRQDEQRGTAHAIGCAEGKVDDKFIVLNGDMLVSSSHLRKLGARTEKAVVTVKRVDKPKDFGVIRTSGNRVMEIIEKPTKPPTDLANAGIYLFDPAIFDYVRKTGESLRGELEITDTIQMLINKGHTVGYERLKDEWIDIGRPWDLLDSNNFLLSGMEGKLEDNVNVEPFATLQGEISVGKGTIIRNGAYIIGPAVIGKNCDIGPNCFIRPATAIGNNVHIGNAVEVKNSIIMDGTKIGHLSYIGDSIIGRNCNFGAGTKVANLRHDGKNIKVPVKGELVDSGRRKLGVIMGDDVHTAINTSINVGCVMETGSITRPGESVR